MADQQTAPSLSPSMVRSFPSVVAAPVPVEKPSVPAFVSYAADVESVAPALLPSAPALDENAGKSVSTAGQTRPIPALFVPPLAFNGTELNYGLDLMFPMDEAKTKFGLDLLQTIQGFVLRLEEAKIKVGLDFMTPEPASQLGRDKHDHGLCSYLVNFDANGNSLLVRTWVLCACSGWFWYEDGFDLGYGSGTLSQLGRGVGTSGNPEIPASFD